MIRISNLRLLFLAGALILGIRAVKASPADEKVYNRQWKQADSLEKSGLPKSALEVVNAIYGQAKQQHNDPQQAKAVIWKLKLEAQFREDFFGYAVKMLKGEINSSTEPLKSIFHSLLGEVYVNYYNQNAYRFAGRSAISGFRSDSIQTWDPGTITTEANHEYLVSLNDPEGLKTVPISKFSIILESKSGEDDAKNIDPALSPTLYDFLMYRALGYFTSYDGMKAGLADTVSKKEIALKLFSDAAAFHLNDSNPKVYVNYELLRLAYLHEKSGIGKNDTLYSGELLKLENRYISSPVSASVAFARVTYLNEQGSLYEPLVSQDHKWDLKKALEVCDNTVKRYPDSDGGKNCRELSAEIRKPSLQMTTAFAVCSDKKFPALLDFRNVPEIFFRLVSADPEEFRRQTDRYDREKVLKYLYGKYFVKAWSQKLPSDGDFQQYSMEITAPEVPAGYYILVASADEEFSDVKAVAAYHVLWSTQISYISQHNDHGGYDVYVLDRETGKPLKGAAVEAYTRVYNYMSREWAVTKTGEYTTGEDGFFSLSDPAAKGSNRNLFMKIKYKNDLFTTGDLYIYPVSDAPPKTLVQTNFYTDRAIYRPGQTIWFKGIVMEKTGENYSLRPGFKTTVTFRDVNYREIAKTTFTSNEFGSFNGSFTAPAGVLNGMMTISNESGSVSVSVEEYRRPAFEVTFDPVDGNYKLGQTVTVKGKAAAYAGNALAGATVSYRVVRNARFPFYDWYWYRPMPVSQETEIVSGTTTTGPDGMFSVSFTATPDATVPAADQPVFDFTVFADVTDLNGEMQSGSGSVSVGYTSLVLSSTLPEKVNLEADSAFTISSTNLNGRSTPCEVTVTLKRLKQPDRAFIPRLWHRPDLTVMSRDEFHSNFPYDIYMNENDPAAWPMEYFVFEKTMNTGNDSVIFLNKAGGRWQVAGTYKLTLTALDPFGTKTERTSYFTAYDPAAKEMPVRTMNWFVPLKISGEPGEKASFLVGSTEDDVNVIYEVRVHDSLYSRSWLKISDRQLAIDVPILEGFRGGFSVNFTFVKHNRVFQNSQAVTVPWTNRKLDIAFETFRDKITPGANEEWKVRITGPGKQAAEAEFLATMYDASLDAFRPNEWSFSILPSYTSLDPWENADNFRANSGTWYPLSWNGPDYILRETDRLNWFGTSYLGGGSGYRGRLANMDGGGRPVMMMEKDATVAGITGQPPPPSAVPQASESAETKAPQQAPVLQVRRDFRETAFFYPSIVTDSTGALILKFTAPESLTRWRLMGLGYTKDLKYSTIEKTAFTTKELMVMPNPPRFVRQGDTVVFSSKIVNLSGADQNCTVTLTLTDPVTNISLDKWINGSSDHQIIRSSVTIVKGSSSPVSWEVVVPADASASLLQYRVTAAAGNFSDGEEKILPVLPNRMMVTETMPLPVRGKGSFQFSLDKLSKSRSAGSTLNNYRLTLEFAGNPAWYAVQALPSLNEVTYQSADNIFDAYYSNALASFIANSDPKIKSVFESWKQLTANALLSNLEKNEDLKTALLRETPWVLEARDESANKQRLGLYFDQNNLKQNLDRNMTKLQKLQLPNGAWAWFEGMPENRWVTQEILTGLGRLNHIGAKNIIGDPRTLEMVEKILEYLDDELVKDYENIKKYYPDKMDQNHLSSIQVQYLYARSFFNSQFAVGTQQEAGRSPFTEEFVTAYNYFNTQMARYWLSQDLSVQAMIALGLARSGDTKTPAAILKSLGEKALHSPELGMYWAMNPGFFWSQAPVETQAMLIEAFDEISHDQKSVDDMNVWLLKQKQTQIWPSRRATADACYALLLRGTSGLATDPGITIKLGPHEIDPSKLKDNQAEAGTGYFRMSWNGDGITPDMSKITITKSTEGVAWGGIYWQYFENLDKITQQQTPLKVSREIYVGRNTDKGPILDKMQDAGCRIGDKITVRIILIVDRDMEFVHMKDMRAAGLEPQLAPSPPFPHSPSTGEGLSGYRYQDGLGYYQSVGDVGASFFFDRLPKGTWVFEYPLKVNNAGDFSNGITTVQCLYAPEFSAHSEGVRVVVK